jgi:hypothetical protein
MPSGDVRQFITDPLLGDKTKTKCEAMLLTYGGVEGFKGHKTEMTHDLV